ncbi:MAG: S9 family peptidase, partial [Chloroflexota bacterium]
MGQVTAPYGSWASPFPIELLAKGAIAFSEITAAGGRRWWLEGRADESGRQVLLRRDPDGGLVRLTPEGFNCRNRVHEYGGGAYVVAGDVVVVSDFSTGRLHRIADPERVEPLTPDGHAWRYASLSSDPSRNRLIAVREDHDPDTLARHGEAENAIVAVDIATGDVEVLAGGSDF